MSIHFYESIPKGFPKNFNEVIERFEETAITPNRHEHFTEEELKALLKLCKLAEQGAELRHGVDGFSLVSNDRSAIEAMLREKQQKFISLPRFI